MQKSLLIVLLVAVFGALAIYFFNLQLPAYFSFALGAIIAAAINYMTASTSTAEITPYKGPIMTLYVGNLPYRVNETEVKTLFEKYGPVNSVRLVRDRKTGRRKGFGFVEISEKGGQQALAKLNDFIFQERTLKVREAKSQDTDRDDAE
ncbi:RNA recognition motif domain-containing protein [Shewanella dokdonensis]|uniref:RNA-binding protein n=1 Tax=Shewanella dokdonensis TaxID=712036 RepID=A0ABX8DI24_9GAMM|nr:RNA-binding protein [Shewanella dokdonensis]MCL1076240.1 RNA-binding protein [Shewanella dokdonensis]QVK24386.1 RNA-binding protein [Shewanella dokdonensis]